MRPSSPLTLILASCVLAGCAGTGAAPAGGEVAPSAAASPYGLFLAGRAASAQGQSGRAADLYQRASVRSGGAAFLGQRAFQAALAAGDIPRAAELAPQGAAVEDLELRQLGLMVRGADALARGRATAALTTLGTEDIAMPHRGAAALLTQWAAAGAGQTDRALADPDVGNDVIAAYFGRLSRARILERSGRPVEAERGLRELLGQGDPDSMATLALGGLLERSGRWQDAVNAYDQALERNPGDYPVGRARERARAHRVRPAAPTVPQGAAEALIGPVQGMIVRRRLDLALTYLRLVLHLDPERADALVILGDLLTSQGDLEGARAAFLRVPQGAPQYPLARSKLAWSYYQAGQADRAIAEAEALTAGQPVASGAALTLADLLRSARRYDEAVAVLSRLIADPTLRPDWRVYYMRAGVQQDAGRAMLAEADARAALELSPQQPELLTFLAYALIDRGERLDEGMDLARRATAASPQSAVAQDALGWGHYRQGQFAQAVEALERAALMAPASARINDHLGDAYWRVGRRTEAVFQWRRTLSLDPDARLRAGAEAKIASPLGPDAPPASAPQPAAS